MTYACTIACDHCCFACSPDASDAVMPVDKALKYLEELHQLDRAVHIAGGEPFKHYDRLRDIVRAAHGHGIAPHFVETNGSWCVSDELVRERLSDLERHGVLWLLISTDLYHLRLVDVDRVARCMAIAEETFGPGTTMGLCTLEELHARAELARDDNKLLEHLGQNPPRLVGRAWQRYAHMLEPKPLAELDLETGWGLDPENTCNREWDPLWEIHVDPYGNVQTNCGIILGNAGEIPISELMDTWHERSPFLRRFSERGVAALLETALDYGFEPDDTYPQKCYLCTRLRMFLRARDPQFRMLFGPDEVYAQP